MPDKSYDELLSEARNSLTEEEIDDYLYRPKKQNTRKSLAALFVYQIIVKDSDSGHHLSQKYILERLKEYPYEVSMERRALGRILAALCDSGLGIVSFPHRGVWYEKEQSWDDGAA